LIHLAKSYLKFLWESKNEYSVHSPFVFDLLVNCFYDASDYPEYDQLKSYRKALLEDKRTIQVTDFGAGSRVFKSNERQITKIASTAGITPERAELLFRVSRYFKPHHILEIGTSLGLATSALSLGNPGAKISTLEGCAETAGIAREQFGKFNFKNIESVVAEFDNYLERLNPEPNSVDLIYFDGNHQKDATLRYFELLLPTSGNDSVWIFDDIHWSPDMESAWETIKRNPKVTVTIDTFQWGFVFFRKEQPKQDFIIRC
jgi:predicted O-methyltransferase YrrM